ncbi:hypothetical protein ACHAXT_008265 [Thalassiosira profunda]
MISANKLEAAPAEDALELEVERVASVLRDAIGCIGGAADVLQTLQQSLDLLNGLERRASSREADSVSGPVQSIQHSENKGDQTAQLQTLAGAAVSSTQSLHDLIKDTNKGRRSSKKSSGHAWKALQSAVSSTFDADASKPRGEDKGSAQSTELSHALAILAIGVALALDTADPAGTKMVASAVLPGDGKTHYPSVEVATLVHSVARDVVLTLLRLVVKDGDATSIDLQVLARIESGFHVGEFGRSLNEGMADAELAEAVATLADRVSRQVDAGGEAINGGKGELVAKDLLAPVMSLVANIRPWDYVDVEKLVRSAAERSLWFSAELLCDAAVESVLMADRSSTQRGRQAMMATSFPKGSESEELLTKLDTTAPSDSIAHVAAGTIIDLALDERSYRRADVFASKYYAFGGPERYAEARFLHACDTVTKVVKKRQVQIIDKQVERVDQMVARVCKDLGLTPASASNNGDKPLEFHGEDVAIESMSEAIRNFSLRRLRATNNHAAAIRLANIWGWKYNQDPLLLEAEAKKRKLTYLQWDDEGCPGSTSDTGKEPSPLPELISEPSHLPEQFNVLIEDCQERIVGFDCEFHDAIKGVALLQLSTVRDSLLLDIPALTKTEEGCAALRTTVGKLFSTSSMHVIGFGCKDDLKRLRASPSLAGTHWFPQHDRSRDLRVLIAEVNPQLVGKSGQHFGLSRICESFLGKALDKAEQCSDWLARPLSQEQKEYAALDAWACAAIAAKIIGGTET